MNYKIQYIIVVIMGCLIASSCIDESLRSDFEKQKPQDEQNQGQDPGFIREVIDPEAALATANCIMVRPGDRFSIPIAKAFAVWTEYRQLYGNVSLKGDLAPILIWAYPENLIDPDELGISDYEDINKATIDGQVERSLMGGALIALAVDGTIRWSWHIWVTDYAPDENLQPEDLLIGANEVTGGLVYRYANEAGDNIFMDRNLGSFPGVYSSYGYEGMYYQWGRKDPFPGFSVPNFIPGSDGVLIPTTYGFTNIPYSIEHPDETINGINDWYSYVSDTRDDDLWGANSRKKTIYDPCPAGWRVPLYGLPFETRYYGGSLGEQTLTYQFINPRKSPIWISESENEFINGISPVLGSWSQTTYIHPEGEKFYLPGGQASYWSASYPSPDIHNSEASTLDPFRKDTFIKRENALFVRCVRDLKPLNK